MSDSVFLAHALEKKDITIIRGSVSKPFHELKFTGRRSPTGPQEDVTIRVAPGLLQALVVALTQLDSPAQPSESKTPNPH